MLIFACTVHFIPAMKCVRITLSCRVGREKLHERNNFVRVSVARNENDKKCSCAAERTSPTISQDISSVQIMFAYRILSLITNFRINILRTFMRVTKRRDACKHVISVLTIAVTFHFLFPSHLRSEGSRRN